MTTSIDDVTERALSRISVTAPYFALQNLTESGDGVVTATIPHTPASGSEVGAMEAAQVARHLAILGSCAAALSRDDDTRHHYLATKAHFTRMAAGSVVDGGIPADDLPLTAEAVASWVDRRKARALMKLCTASGRALNMLDVEYTVLAPKMFARFNPAIDLDQLAEADSVGELSFDVLGLDRGDGEGETQTDRGRTRAGVRVECGPIPAKLCEGHFPDYPAAPVAIVMGELCRAAGLGMVRALGRDGHRYRIEEGRVEATGLARAGQRLTLEARYDAPAQGGNHRMIGRALADGEVVGEVDVVMSAHAPAPKTSATYLAGDPVDYTEVQAELDSDDPTWFVSGASPC